MEGKEVSCGGSERLAIQPNSIVLVLLNEASDARIGFRRKDKIESGDDYCAVELFA